MNAFLPLGNGELWQLAGWTMVHFLWLGTVAGLAAMVCRLALRRAPANVRYAAALACFALTAVLPVGIAAWLAAKPQATYVATPAGDGYGPQYVAPDGYREPYSAVRPQNTSVQPASGLSEHVQTAAPAAELLPRANAALESCARFLPWLWLVGTPLTFVLLTTGLVGAERLRRASRVIGDGPIAEACVRLTEALRIGRRVTVAVCERIAAPVLVGIVRPIILLPPAALTGWSPDEIEMVLLHELAHVRRWDNLVNLVQWFIESLLFFHPAVWLVSSWVRREREACCDAVVVGRTNRPHAYAEMLVALAAQMPRSVLFHPAATSAMAAGPLRGRIRRVLGLEDDPMLVSGKSLAVVMSSLLLVAILLLLKLPTPGQAKESITEGMEDTKSHGDVIEQRAQEAITQNNLKDLSLALLNYQDVKKYLPPHASFDATGKPLLSWRVLVLPFMGKDEAKLFEEFHLDEPWDSEHNRRLIARMPEVFKNPKIDQSGMTNYLAVVGPECVFTGTAKGIRIAQISDGTSKTIALVEADADRAVEWTKPQDWEFDRRNPTTGLGSMWNDHWYGAWVDGSNRRVDNNEAPDAVGIQFTCAGREARSLSESEGRQDTEPRREIPEFGGKIGGEFGGEMAGAAPSLHPKFPTLEEQKLADLAWKRMGLELEPIGDEDLKRVQALGYEGGLKITGGAVVDRGLAKQFEREDILVGLHVWPTTSLEDVAEVLNRKDLVELSPLKFYVVRNVIVEAGGYGPSDPEKRADVVVNGRIHADMDLDSAPIYSAISPPPHNPTDYYGRVWPTPATSADAALSVGVVSMQNKVAADALPKPALLYEGKTFEEWRDIWRNELSTEKRLEAVMALSAFGASGRGKEAAEAIVEVAPQYGLGEWIAVFQPTDASEGPGRVLVREILDALGASNGGLSPFKIPTKDSVAALAAAAKSDDLQRRQFAVVALARMMNAEAANVLVTLLCDKDPSIRNLALGLYSKLTPSVQPGIDHLKQVIEENESPEAVALAEESLAVLEGRFGTSFKPENNPVSPQPNTVELGSQNADKE